MTLTNVQALGIVLAVTLGTVITRFLPFALFPDSRPVPKIVEYLGRTLPAAMMGLLVVYCLRNVDIAAAPHGKGRRRLLPSLAHKHHLTGAKPMRIRHKPHAKGELQLMPA